MELNDKAGQKGKKMDGKEVHDVVAKPGFFSKMKNSLKEGLMVLGVASAVTVGVGACSSNTDETQPIPAEDAGCVDGGCGGDAGPKDAGNDKDSGPVTDAGPEHDSGSGGSDAGPDVDGGQGGQDSGVSDGGADAGPAACAIATTGSYSGYVNKVSPVVVGGYSFLYTGKSTSDGGVESANYSIVCGGATVNNDMACQLGVETPLEVPADGKKITVKPTQAGAGSSVATIKVEELSP
jgi:hypothetical protein